MTNSITLEEIDEKVRSKVYTQDYSKKPQIDGVKNITLPYHIGDDGDFIELMRVSNEGEFEQFPGFHVAQISRTRMFKGTVKAWHLHFKQDEIWFIPPEARILVGLWDVRKNSKTKGVIMRMVTGGGNAQLIFIPKGVAHGSSNLLNEPTSMIYFVDNKFDIKNPDEKRIPWDSLGSKFWEAARD